jgi:hypothetical protein
VIIAYKEPEATLRLVSTLSDGFYSGDEIPASQHHQIFFAEILTSKFHTATEVLDIEAVILSQPKLGWDLLQGRNKTIESQQEKICSMYEKLPKSKRKVFD